MTAQKFSLSDLNDEAVSAINDAEIAAANRELDAKVIDHDEAATVARLASLNALKYAKQRTEAARELGITVSALDKAVKEVKSASADTKGQGRPLELPAIEPWPHAVNGPDLLDAMCRAIRSYVVAPEGSAEVMALWALHTHAFNCFNISPRLAVTSPEKGCGKTTALDVLRELVARPLPTSNASVAAVFRIVEMAEPTLLIDEADTFLKENDELRGILNTGHRKGGQVTRTVGDDHEPRQFSTWAPAAIAMIGNLPATLDDRSITIRLKRRKPSERVQSFRADRVTELGDLARKSARWAGDGSAALVASDPDTGQLFNRAADNWRPLLAIADLAGGEWPGIARSIAHSTEAERQDQSIRTKALADIRDTITARPHSDRITSNELATALGLLESRPWAEWRNGKPITAAALARLLSPFGIAPTTIRVGAETFKGYVYSAFNDAFASYLPDQSVTPSQPNNDGLCYALQTVTENSDVTLSKAQKPNDDGPCYGVTVSRGDIGGCEDMEGRATVGRQLKCAQCGRDGAELETYYGTADPVWLHRGTCEDAWRAACDGDGLTIPPYLDRRPGAQA
jgi:hypothetical protein